MGEPSGFYKLFSENKLDKKGIKALLLGRSVTGYDPTGKQWLISVGKDGNAAITYGEYGSDNGKHWVEDDMQCYRWNEFSEGLKDCTFFYRNPEGTPDSKDEYLGVSIYGIIPFSIVE